MTIQTTGSDDVIEQITKHLNRLIEVVKVVDLTEGAYTERELMMVKVRAVGKEREEMKRMATSSVAASSTSPTRATPSSSPATRPKRCVWTAAIDRTSHSGNRTTGHWS